MDPVNIRKIFPILFLLMYNCLSAQQLKPGTINRKEIVQRYNLHITDLNEPGPTQVGNGDFAYGFDITGMQTLTDKFTTMSQWSWHSTPSPDNLTGKDFKKTYVDTHERMMAYDLPNPSQPKLTQWLASNPHRFNLGRIGLWIKNDDGTMFNVFDIQHAVQHFDLWSGIATSTFKVHGQSVKVITVADPQKDIVAFKIESPLMAANRIGVFIEFPYASLDVFSNGSDYGKPDLHSTQLINNSKKHAIFLRTMDNTHYQVALRWNDKSTVKKIKAHKYVITPSGNNAVEYVFSFCDKKSRENLPAFSEVESHSRKYWLHFWNSGGFIDLSQSKDPRWNELQRRIILSEYNMKINASGNYPPQETGLVSNSWYGRFHYEMILWHEAQFALWNKWDLLNNCLHVYKDNLESAKQRAAMQGYAGARFPKCTGPDGREWPHPIHAFLVWQQPTPIFFADLDYRAHPDKATLQKWSAIIDATGDFLASYPYYDSLRKEYILGPPIAFVSENNDFYKDKNPAFELGYWRYALRTASYLRKKEGVPKKPLWDSVYNQLAPIPEENNAYVQWEDIHDMWTHYNFEHPALLGIYGLLPGDGVDTSVMKNTFHKVMNTWKFDTGWGWDFPLTAMTAARLGEPGEAIDMLLYSSPKNGYDKHGFVGGGNPYPYFPANGGLLYAVAMMAAGWDNDGNIPQPGFPKNGSWTVRWEGLMKAP